MTFEEFQATRREVDDLETVTEYEEHKGCPGLAYLGRRSAALYIEKRTPAWENTPAVPYEFMLVIGNSDWLSNDVGELERKLYEFAVSEGYVA